jgi:DNA-binding Lrp family transcriptional regulator
MHALDYLDKKIIFELDMNSRQSISQLAKKLRKNRNVIEYRIKTLEENGIIKGYITTLDPGSLGLMAWNVYLEFQNTTTEIEEDIIRYLEKRKNIWWIAVTTGKWNLIYSIVVKNVQEFYYTVRSFNEKYGSYVLNQSLASHVEIDILSRGYLVDQDSECSPWFKTYEAVELDDIDKSILKNLAKNSRISSVELARSLGMTSTSVSRRIKELVRKGVIVKFRLDLDVSHFGYKYFKILIHLKNITKRGDTELKEYCRRLRNVFHYEKKIGPWMLEIELDEMDYSIVYNMLKKMKETFPDYIKNYDIMIIFRQYKAEMDLTELL